MWSGFTAATWAEMLVMRRWGEMRAFREYHPAVNFIYFAFVIGFAMFMMHPFFLGITLAFSLGYALQVKRDRMFRFQFAVLLLAFILAALINALFNHAGTTVLAYFPNGNPLTAEALLYGAAAGVMLVSVICWFSCFNEIMTSDKIIYLFGRLAPSLSLVFSMTLRFVPRFRHQLTVISVSQRAIGCNGSGKGCMGRVRNGIKIFSIMLTWALENAVETADSMKGRGYGLVGRTAFSIYRFQKRDVLAMIYLFLLSVYVLCCCLAGAAKFSYFPSMGYINFNLWGISLFFSYFLLCAMPLGLELWEAKKWRL